MRSVEDIGALVIGIAILLFVTIVVVAVGLTLLGWL